MSLRERLARQPPGYNFTIGRILAIYSGLMVTLLLAALDQTIVATALPKIVSDLGGITQYSWVFTAYMLTSTVTVPLYGKLGDVYGRKNLFLFAIVVFLIGSALCGLATSMTQLVVFRAIQGVGGGGIFPLSLAVIGNIVPPRDRGRWQGLIGAVFAASSIIGPAVGAFVAAATLLAAFAVVERQAPEPILPFEILRNPIVAGSVACMALVGMAMFGTITYVPLFVQGVIGTSATSSGVVLTPLMLGAVTTSLLTGQLVSHTGRYRWNAILGPSILTAGMVLLWRMTV